MRSAFPWMVLTFITVMASGVFVAFKYLMEFIGPVELLTLRFLPASIVSIIIIALFYRNDFARIIPKLWWFFIIRELLALFGFHYTIYYAETILPAGISALVVGLWPIITIILASIFVDEKLTGRKMFGALLGFAGAAVVILEGAKTDAVELNISHLQWIHYSLILLIAPVSAALVTVASRWYLAGKNGDGVPDSLLFTLICRAPSGFFALGLLAFYGNWGELSDSLAHTPPLFWVVLGILSLYNSLAGFWLNNWAIQKLSAGSVAMFTYLQTALALVIAWFFLKENLNSIKVVGAIVIIIGLVISNIEKRPNQHPINITHQ